MEMEDRLTRFCVHVEDGSVTLLCDAEVLGNLARCCKHVGQEPLVFRRNVVQSSDVLSWANKNMDGRLWIDVVKSHNLIVFIRDLRWQFLLRDSAE